jgi:hypothetical protein
MESPKKDNKLSLQIYKYFHIPQVVHSTIGIIYMSSLDFN